MDKKKIARFCVCPLLFLFVFSCAYSSAAEKTNGLPVYYWNEVWHGETFVNFGDYLSIKLVERIVGAPVSKYVKDSRTGSRKLLAIGSILSFADQNDVIWGTGASGKKTSRSDYPFTRLDVRAVRGPLTRAFLREVLHVKAPAVYGDPALLLPCFFPEFKKADHPEFPYIIIPHFSERHYFPKSLYPQAVYPTDPWYEVLAKILNSQFVISSSLHGIIVAEAWGIPARLLRLTDNEPLFKFQDYYLGTNRPDFQYAHTVKQALEMGGERPYKCDLKKLYHSFPFDYWPGSVFPSPDFTALDFRDEN